MARLLTGLVFLLVLASSFLLPAGAAVAGPPICLVQDILITLPATDVTDTTAVLQGREIEVYELVERAAARAMFYPWVFKYGTEPGIYTKQVRAHLKSHYVEPDFASRLVKEVWTDEAELTDLSPCTTYYAKYSFDLPEGIAIVLDPPCPTEFVPAKEISFTTTGCRGARSHGAGGYNGITPTTGPMRLSNIVVKSAAVSQPRAAPGEKVDITATLANNGAVNGSTRVTLYVNGREADSRGVTVTSGETTPVHFFTSAGEPGTYQVYVNGTPAGSFTVDAFGGNDVLIYGVIALFVIGISGVFYFLLKKRTA